MDDLLKAAKQLLDDYFIMRSIDDTDVEQRIPELVRRAYAAGVQAERERARGVAQAILDDFPPHWHPAAHRLLAELVPLPDDG